MFDSSNAPVTKAVGIWGGVSASKILGSVGINSWGDFAAMCAALYSLALLLDWVWKKMKGGSSENGK